MIALRSAHWFSAIMIGSLAFIIIACSSLATPTLPVTNAPDSADVSSAPIIADPTDVPDATIIPAAPSLASQSNEDLFRKAMVAMHSLQSVRVKLNFEEQDGEDIVGGTIEGEQSGETFRSIAEDRGNQGFGGYEESICIPPYVFSRESSDGNWYRQGIEVNDGACSFLILSRLFIFPQIGLPLRLYDLTSLGIENIGDVPTRHLRVNVDWAGISNWLVEEGHLAEVASLFSMSVDEVEDIYFEDAPDSLEVWIDADGFMHEMALQFDEDNITAAWRFSAFNLPIIIEPPAQFDEGPPAGSDQGPLTRIEEKSPVDTAGSWSTPDIEVSVVPATLEVGATAIVAATAKGQGGLPQFTLNVDPAVLKINTANPLSYSNFSTVPQWTIEGVAAGSTSLSVSVSYETQTCSDGNCYFNFTGTGSPSVVVEVVPATPPAPAGKIAPDARATETSKSTP